MKKSLNAWSVDPNTNFEDMFAQLKQAGFDGLELNVDGEGRSVHSLSLETTDKELADIYAISQKYDLPVVSISSSLWGNGCMGSAKKEDREYSRKLLDKQLNCAKTLGATGILIVPAGISNDVSIVEAYKNSLDTLEYCKDVIEKYKLKVGLEHVWNMFFTSAFDMVRFIDGLNCEYISAYYDAGNIAAFSWPEYWIEILGKRISHVHIKDFKKTTGWFNGGGTWPPLLEGGVNFKKVIPELRKIGWDGYLTAEVSKPENQTYEEFYKSVVEAEKKIIACDY